MVYIIVAGMFLCLKASGYECAVDSNGILREFIATPSFSANKDPVLRTVNTAESIAKELAGEQIELSPPVVHPASDSVDTYIWHRRKNGVVFRDESIKIGLTKKGNITYLANTIGDVNATFPDLTKKKISKKRCG